MRKAEENGVWRGLRDFSPEIEEKTLNIENASIDLTQRCIILGGKNGSGKTRVLRSIRQKMGDKALSINLHELCEYALRTLRSRDDYEEMVEEYESSGPDRYRLNDIVRIVGKDYKDITWYALEVEPSEDSIAEQFTWGGEQPLIPYFMVTHLNKTYTSLQMGLGEFSIHFLFWILEQYREEKKITLLLDEPDAYLPPIGASALLLRLINVCKRRDWQLVLTSHSSEIIAEGVRNGAFTLLRTDKSGSIESTHCRTDPGVADTLIARPAIQNIIFVEDQSAHALAEALIGQLPRHLSKSTFVIWGNGEGYLRALQGHFPKPPGSKISFTYLFDGDQRENLDNSEAARWPALCLPSTKDPDKLFMDLAVDVDSLAKRLNRSKQSLSPYLDSIEGSDPHDWVNDLGAEYGRPVTLRALAELWVDSHSNEVKEFLDSLKPNLFYPN